MKGKLVMTAILILQMDVHTLAVSLQDIPVPPLISHAIIVEILLLKALKHVMTEILQEEMDVVPLALLSKDTHVIPTPVLQPVEMDY